MSLKIQERLVGDVVVVDITGRMTLGQACEQLRECVDGLLLRGHRKVVFNLPGCTYSDSSGIGALVTAFALMSKQGGQIKLANLTKKVHDLLQITKLYPIFEVCNDEAAAVASFERSAKA